MEDFLDIKIAVDFDGTIVEHEYPSIGKEKLFAFRTLKEFQDRGARLILWTFRSGIELEEAVEFCKLNGLEFYSVNSNYPGEVFDGSMMSRKIDADLYIDDKNIGGLPGWGEIWQLVFPYGKREQEYEKKIRSSGNIIKRFLNIRKNEK